MSRVRGRVPRIALVALIAVGVVVVPMNLIARSSGDSAAAQWTPLLLGDPGRLRAAPTVTIGSAEDVRELDDLVARQTAAVPPLTAERIAYWTDGPSVIRWNEIFLDVVRDAGTNPVRVSRTLGLLNAAMYDALIAATDAKVAYPRPAPADRDSRIEALAAADPVSSYASRDAAIAAAATAVLGSIYPHDSTDFEALAAEVVAIQGMIGTHTTSDVAAGTAIGEAVGLLAIARAKGDGADAWGQDDYPVGDGLWQPALAFRTVQPTEALAGTWKPWLMSSGSQFRPEPPPIYGSAEWQAEADELVRVNEDLTPDEIRIARFWADGTGTDTPPGHWVRIAIDLIVRDRLSTPDAARVLAHLAVAQADSFIACWDSKFFYWTARPIALIPGFASTVITPNFPSYVSGHATVSGASGAVLAAFFPADADVIDQQAEEAAVSRLYGGIHWRSDNEVGLRVGREVAALALAHARGDGALR